MSTTEAAPRRPVESISSDFEPARGRAGPTIAVVALVAVLLGGVIGWLVRDDGGDATDLPAEVEQLLAAYERTWEVQDVDGFDALVTDDFVLREILHQPLNDGFFTEDFDADTAHAVNAIWRDSHDVGHLRDPIVVGDGPWFVFVIDSWIGEELRDDGVSAYVFVEDGGVLRVASHVFVGSTSPID